MIKWVILFFSQGFSTGEMSPLATSEERDPH